MSEENLPPLICTPPGLYRHYKGGMYRVEGTVRHSESLEPMTLYRALYGEQGLWVQPRFQKIDALPQGAGAANPA